MTSRTTFSSLKKSELKNIKKISFLNELAGKYVSIYVVSNLINFNFNNLMKYSSILKLKLENKIKIDHVHFNAIQGMEYSFPALTVKIENDGKIKYESILLSLSDNFQSNEVSTRLPILCVIKDSGIKVIHSSMEKLFNCNIRPCSVTYSELLWLTGIGINESILRKKNDGINISFSLPNYFKQASIDVHLPEKSLEEMWLACRSDPVSNVLKRNEIESFFQGLLIHLKNTYGISLQFCNLDKVSLQDIIFINGEEKFQMFISSEEILYYVLTFIHADCVNRLLD